MTAGQVATTGGGRGCWCKREQARRCGHLVGAGSVRGLGGLQNLQRGSPSAKVQLDRFHKETKSSWAGHDDLKLWLTLSSNGLHNSFPKVGIGIGHGDQRSDFKALGTVLGQQRLQHSIPPHNNPNAPATLSLK